MQKVKSVIRKFNVIRKLLLIRILNAANFRYFSGHWIFLNDITEDSVIVDLGANKAAFSRKMVDIFGANVLAVEANYKLCKDIQYEKIKVYNFAITDSDECIEFYISDNDESSSIIEDFQRKWSNTEKLSVQGVTWKSLIESFTSDDLKSIKQITVEFHDWLNQSLHERTVNAIKKICDQGFISITDAPDHTWPVEMLFLNKKELSFTLRQKLFHRIFNFFTFLNY
jgi:FkbM family methyltransferase